MYYWAVNLLIYYYHHCYFIYAKIQSQCYPKINLWCKYMALQRWICTCTVFLLHVFSICIFTEYSWIKLKVGLFWISHGGWHQVIIIDFFGFYAWIHPFTNPYTFFQGGNVPGQEGVGGGGGGYKDKKERNVWILGTTIKFYTIRLYYIDSVFK